MKKIVTFTQKRFYREWRDPFLHGFKVPQFDLVLNTMVELIISKIMSNKVFRPSHKRKSLHVNLGVRT